MNELYSELNRLKAENKKLREAFLDSCAHIVCTYCPIEKSCKLTEKDNEEDCNILLYKYFLQKAGEKDV